MPDKAVRAVKDTEKKQSAKDTDKNSDYVRRTMEANISPLELIEYPVFTSSDDAEKGIFSVVRVNSLDLGALYPAQYRVVTNRNNQSVRLSTWAFRRVSEIFSQREVKGWICFYVPAKMLTRGTLRKLLENEAKKGSEFLSNIVIEVSSEILYNDSQQVAQQMNELRNDFGIRFLLSEYADEYCPVLRLSDYPVDFVLLDRTIDTPEKISSPAVINAVKIAKDSGKRAVLGVPGTSSFRRAAIEAGIEFYMPDLSATERRE